jgi:hypothetical protein
MVNRKTQKRTKSRRDKGIRGKKGGNSYWTTDGFNKDEDENLFLYQPSDRKYDEDDDNDYRSWRDDNPTLDEEEDEEEDEDIIPYETEEEDNIENDNKASPINDAKKAYDDAQKERINRYNEEQTKRIIKENNDLAFEYKKKLDAAAAAKAKSEAKSAAVDVNANAGSKLQQPQESQLQQQQPYSQQAASGTTYELKKYNYELKKPTTRIDRLRDLFSFPSRGIRTGGKRRTNKRRTSKRNTNKRRTNKRNTNKRNTKKR